MRNESAFDLVTLSFVKSICVYTQLKYLYRKVLYYHLHMHAT